MRENQQMLGAFLAVATIIIMGTLFGLYLIIAEIIADNPTPTPIDERPNLANTTLPTLVFVTNAFQQGRTPQFVALPPSALQTQDANVVVEAFPSLENCQENLNWGLYNVQAGDTFSAIASAYGLTVNELNAGNCLSNPDALFIGQVLRVPLN